jgi:hypothetical protein
MTKNEDSDVRVDEAALVGQWLTDRLPGDWFEGPATVVVDREEITIVGALAPLAKGKGGEETAGTRAGVAAFREATRNQRMAIAHDLEQRSERTVSWGVDVDGERYLFTHLAAPVMTRLRQPERQVLDTLVASGVARSRADALAWCVRLVGEHSDDWLAKLRQAMAEVEAVRAAGPDR